MCQRGDTNPTSPWELVTWALAAAVCILGLARFVTSEAALLHGTVPMRLRFGRFGGLYASDGCLRGGVVEAAGGAGSFLKGPAML